VTLEPFTAALAGNQTMIAVAIICYIGGMFTPGRFAGERLEGFGRAVASKLPYRPPPGKDEETAMKEATDSDE
jgi:hypothetical protein